MRLSEKLNESVSWIRERVSFVPQTGVVLGSGLGGFGEKISEKRIFSYKEIPHFRPTRVLGHAGLLILGNVHDRPVAVLQGRCHYYEGHDMEEVIFPVQTLCALGIRTLLLTNAAGGIRPDLAPGDLMVIRDHLNLMGVNPLRGENDEKVGPRFPDMSRIYDGDLIEILCRTLRSMNLEEKTGVYAAVSGPSYETPAEVRMLAALGADAAGMSTAPEAIAARHMGVRVAGISCITNQAAGISRRPLSHEEVMKTAEMAQDRFIDLLSKAIAAL